MDVTKTLRPGDSGTKRLKQRYGDRLVCVRYRKDAGRQRRYTTVELIVDEAPVRGGSASEPMAIASID
ncbi:MAG: hypothetical protein SV765_16320 [Pseudomonadota bacterium]|nr:hypothetical protein [Pseudomonadota bacterium]